MTSAGSTAATSGPSNVPSTAPATPLLAASVDRPYDQLQALPRPVWLPTLVCAVGSREQRLQHAQAWLAALQVAALPPPEAHFGDHEALAPLRHVVGELGLPALAQGVPTLGEQVLRTVLWHLDRLADLQPRLSRDAAIAQVTAEFVTAWRLDTAGLEDDWQLLRELAAGEQLSWGELTGQLRSRPWAEARRAAERLQQLPALVELLQRLGRSQPRVASPPRRAPQAHPSSARQPLRAQETRIAGAPGELTGVRFGASLERMLPAEAALLRHPVGRRLWRARHAEGRLLAYDTEAVLVDWKPDPTAPSPAAATAAQAQSLAQGPLLLCLDTSGSMRGAPELIAKAVVIAAVRSAQASGRACRLVAFGGPGELVQRDLTGPGGLQAVLDLMGQAFDGGTDIQSPIERAIESVHEAAWCSADVLIVSDGEFGCVASTLLRMDEARGRFGLAVHGVLVGDRETLGMLEVCDHIHWVRHWRRHGDEVEGRMRLESRLAQPVHSKSLTALYFPGALSARAARHYEGARPASTPAGAAGAGLAAGLDGLVASARSLAGTDAAGDRSAADGDAPPSAVRSPGLLEPPTAGKP